MNKMAVARELVEVAGLLAGDKSAATVNPAYTGMLKVQEHMSKLSDRLKLTIRDNKDQKGLVSDLQGAMDLVERASDKVDSIVRKMER